MRIILLTTCLAPLPLTSSSSQVSHYALFVPLLIWLAEVDIDFMSTSVTRALAEEWIVVGADGTKPLLEAFARPHQQSIAANLHEIKDCEIPYAHLQVC